MTQGQFATLLIGAAIAMIVPTALRYPLGIFVGLVVAGMNRKP